MPPVTQYAQSGDVTIAWASFGEGPPVVFMGGLLSHIEHFWEEPGIARFFERMGEFCRLILFDRRGCGLSDPAMPDLAEEVGDLDAVLDAAGVRRATLLGYTLGATLAVRYAVERAERVERVVLLGAVARPTSAPGYEFTHNLDERRERVAEMVAAWGEGATLDSAAPSRASDPRLRAWFARMERLSMSPGQLRRTMAAQEDFDVRADLAQIGQQTLILHRTGDQLIDVGHSRFIAARIPGARFVELAGEDSLPSVGDTDALLGELEEFLSGARRMTGAGERVLRTVLFTDVVDATGTARRLGDGQWREALGALEATTDRCLARLGGTRVKSMGDGALAVFAGPPSQAVRCARSIVDEAETLGMAVRAGLHLGECEHVGADDVGGLAVHVASRVTDLADGGEVLVTSTVAEASLGSGVELEARGKHRLKGLDGSWRLHANPPAA